MWLHFILSSLPTELRWCWAAPAPPGKIWSQVGSNPEKPQQRKPPDLEKAAEKTWMEECMSCVSSSTAASHPRVKVGEQLWSHPDLSLLIWKPVTLPESSDFDDWLLLIPLQANSPSWQSVNNRQLLDSLLSADASPDSSICRGRRSINQSCSQIWKYHHLKTHPAFKLAGRAGRSGGSLHNSVVGITNLQHRRWKVMMCWNPPLTLLSSLRSSTSGSWMKMMRGKGGSKTLLLWTVTRREKPEQGETLPSPWDTPWCSPGASNPNKNVFNSTTTANYWHLSYLPAVTSIPWVHN